MRNKIIPYHPELKFYARELRKKSTLCEVILWQKIRKRALGVQFHRQVPMLNYIVVMKKKGKEKRTEVRSKVNIQ